MFLGLRKLGNICCGHRMFLNKIRNIFCVPDTKFVSATNVARVGKRGNICVGNNVSSFARAFSKPRRRRERQQTKGLMSKTMAVHVHFEFWYISLPSSAKQQREMTKFYMYVSWRTRTAMANFRYLLKLNAVGTCLSLCKFLDR